MSLYPIYSPAEKKVLVATTTECSANPGGNVGWNTTTVFDRDWQIDNGKIVTALAWTSTVASSDAYMFICERVNSTTYRTKAHVALNHSGGGKEWATLATPYVVPASGIFRVGNYTGARSVTTTKGAPNEARVLGRCSLTIDADNSAVEASNSAHSVCVQYAEYQ